jgi:hypothetical protein
MSKGTNVHATKPSTPGGETPRLCYSCGASTLTRDGDPMCTACGADVASPTPPLPPVTFTLWGAGRARLVGNQIQIRVEKAWRVLGEVNCG